MTDELKREFADVNSKLEELLKVFKDTNEVMANTNNTKTETKTK